MPEGFEKDKDVEDEVAGRDDPDGRTEWQGWVSAATVLAIDPGAQVLCPHKGDAYLLVTDVARGPETRTVDRTIRCPTCGAYGTINNPATVR